MADCGFPTVVSHLCTMQADNYSADYAACHWHFQKKIKKTSTTELENFFSANFLDGKKLEELVGYHEFQQINKWSLKSWRKNEYGLLKLQLINLASCSSLVS